MVSKKIPFENLNNVRDLGGMVTEDGRHVKEGMLLRSGRLFEASDADKKRLAEMVDLILDFRSKDEVDKTPDPQLDGVEYIHMSIYDDSFHPDRHVEKTEIDPEGRPLHDGERTRRSMCAMYLQFAENEYAKSQFEFFLRKLLSGQYHCVLWHCTAGKDRTGIGAAILQKILGIPYEDIIEDYMLTNEYMAGSTSCTAILIITLRRDCTFPKKKKSSCGRCIWIDLPFGFSCFYKLFSLYPEF